MKRLIYNFILLVFLFLITLVIVLSTIGIETNRFNNLISNKVSQSKNIFIEFKSIKFKLDPKKLSLFLETQNPKLNYKDIKIPVKNVKVYIDFLSLLLTDPKIEKTTLSFEEIDIVQLNKLSVLIKPSNLKSLINNKIKKGKLISEIEIFLNDSGMLENFIAKGTVKNMDASLIDGINLKNTNLDFFTDKNDTLIKNIFGYINNIKISDGDIKLNLDNGIKLNSNFNSKIDLNEDSLIDYLKILKKFGFAENVIGFKANLNNTLYLNFDQTFKVTDYNYSISGNVEKGEFELIKPFKNHFISEKINKIYFSNLELKTIFLPKKINSYVVGKYSFNNLDYFKINFENEIFKDNLNLKIDFDFDNQFKIDFINYEKSKGIIGNLSLDFKKVKNNIKIDKLNFSEKKNFIKVNNLRFEDNNFLSFKDIIVKTYNNDFIIQGDRKIFIKGSKYDATNLVKFFSKSSDVNRLKNLNNSIEIDFKNIKVPMSEKLRNFKLLGEIRNGKFVKITSKGDFGNNNFLDITMRKDNSSDRKYLEIYSDLTRPLLNEYSFFKGLSGGKLLFTSIIGKTESNSNLKIENFKIVNAPAVVKLLSLADLGGLADLAEGEGLSFDVLEIDMEKSKDFLKINEIIALGPSMSVLMEGYQGNELTSLRGTLVPAKTLNKMISKIPVIGDIIIPKEIGEGLFGISFKIKGPKGNMKTTINPIRTLTPRFIQKIIDKNKDVK